VDRIVVPGIPLRAQVGTTEEERASPQEIRVFLSLYLDLETAGRSDALEDTVDYDAVCATVAEIVASRPFHLIESLAREVAAAVLASFDLEEVEVRVEKPDALKARGVPFAAVEIRRSRHA